jgi:hypothetical protein
MLETPFIITVDTEGDNLWEKPRDISTRNAAFLPRFQTLCEKFHFHPVYLVNYEMANSDQFVEFGRDAASRGTAEIGMHLHAWNCPPIERLTRDDYLYQPYLIEYPDRVMKAKIQVMTRLLEERFDRKIVSHRAGRWAFNGRYADMLLDEGYLVDCSVTPGVDWSQTPGDPEGKGGSDYTSFPDIPYWLHSPDISSPCAGGLLEVPMTVSASKLFQRSPAVYEMPFLRRLARKVSPARSWLCPVPLLEKHNDRAMLDLARAMRQTKPVHLEFMLHSSELMPGGSPSFRTSADIDRLYGLLERLFEEISTWCQGMTLKQFRDWWMNRTQTGVPGSIQRHPDRSVKSTDQEQLAIAAIAEPGKRGFLA